MALISEMVTYSSFYVIAFQIRSLLRVSSYSVGGGGRGGLVRMRTYIYIMKRWLAAMLSGVVDRKRMTRHPE